MASYQVDPAALSSAAQQCSATQTATRDAASVVAAALRDVGASFPDARVVDAAADAAMRWVGGLSHLDEAAGALSASLNASAQLYGDAETLVRGELGGH